MSSRDDQTTDSPVLDYGKTEVGSPMPTALKVPVVIFSVGILILVGVGIVTLVVKVINVITR